MNKNKLSKSAAISSKEERQELGVKSLDIFAPLRAWVEKKSPKSIKLKAVLFVILAIATIVAFASLLSTSLSAVEKFMGTVALMAICGEITRGLFGWDGFFGIIMLKDRSMLNWIDKQAHKYAAIWSAIADIGIVLGYGFLGYRLLGPWARRGKELALLAAAGFLLMFIFSAVIMPSAYDIIKVAVGEGDLQAASEHLRSSTPIKGTWELTINGITYSIPIMSTLMLLILLIGGLAASAMLSMILYAISLIAPILMKLGSIVLELAGQEATPVVVPPPGGVPLIIGVNLDLVSGLVAMAVLLVAHELSHAFLARIHKIRLDSAGVVFFGILPFGAFVEPDEKELQGLEDWKANQVLAAGSAMNMIVAVIAFTILLALAIVNEYYLLKGAVVAFVARCLALIVALNVLVGVVNLLPLPMFDGHRLMKSLVKSKSVARIITIVAAAAFVITFLPWLFR